MIDEKILIQNGRIIDPASGRDEVADLLIDDGCVAKIGQGLVANDARVIDAKGMIVAPGLIDIHVHFREPGDEGVETIETGSAAAVAGGYTSVACMPNTSPALDDEASIEFVYHQATRAQHCNVYPVGAITKGRKGEELAEIGQMVRSGAVAFSDDGSGVQNTSVMFRAMQYLKMFNKPILQHCEDEAMSGSGVMNGGVTATRLGLPGIHPIAEDMMIQRDLSLVRTTLAPYHVCHVSTAGAVELVRSAKAEGLPVTTEVCPHHLLLTEEACSTYDTNFKMSPPLRGAADVEACVAAVIDGTIDALVTDHAPHGAQKKDLEFLDAPFGIIGLECALPLFIKALITSGRTDWTTLIERLTAGPARVLSLEKGSLAVGADADIVLIDPDREWTIDVNEFRSRSRNCPFHGWDVIGRAVMTIVDGEVKFDLDGMAS